MKLRLFFEDYENAEPEGDGEYFVPTITETILDPDDEALRDALFQVAEKSALDPVAVLVREPHLSNSSDFVQFFPLVNPLLDKEEEAGPLMNEEIEGHGESEEPSAPPVPGGARADTGSCRRTYAMSNIASTCRERTTRSFLPRS